MAELLLWIWAISVIVVIVRVSSKKGAWGLVDEKIVDGAWSSFVSYSTFKILAIIAIVVVAPYLAIHYIIKTIKGK